MTTIPHLTEDPINDLLAVAYNRTQAALGLWIESGDWASAHKALDIMADLSDLVQ